MSIWLRAVLIVTSFIACACAVSKIRKSRMRVEDAFFWFVIMGIALVFSICPNVAYWGAKLVGIISPVNFVFLAMIFLLLIKVFSLSAKLANLQCRFNELVQEMAVREYNEENQENETGLS
ncbi:MAG: DUF2304 domain-containing protein [Pseudobutyrivibrio sp.]|nr:DUF2304 domain-containing protein [Pseudobutyrivibrio sp.]